ncbi:sensor histidine kinase [Flavobacteriaceae bacterium S356]|uniref:Sensor histidine kinase n=1 Tax=Asprobacillus argus TaxID=3076534 RepID=A0ABU3LBW1_9FLAO|nr:sensor histidine kinase [Flavobacteriaceae bacterium S356]
MCFRGENAFTVVVIYLFFTGVLYGHHSPKIDVTNKTLLHSYAVLEKDSSAVPQGIKGLSYYQKIVDTTQNSTLKLTALDSLIAKTINVQPQVYQRVAKEYVALAVDMQEYNKSIEKITEYCYQSAYNLSNAAQGIQFLELMAPHLEKATDPYKVIRYHFAKGVLYREVGKIEKAIQIYTKIYSGFYGKDSLMIMAALYRRGEDYIQLAKYDNALKDVTEAQSYFKRVNNLYYVFSTQYTLSRLYGQFGLEEKSIDEIKKLIAEKIKINYNDLLSHDYAYLSWCYSDLDDVKNMRKYAQLALDTALEESKANSFVSLSYFYLGLASAYIRNGQLNQCQKYLELGKQDLLKNQLDPLKDFDYRLTSTEYYLKLGRIEDAEKLGLSLFKDFPQREQIERIHIYKLLYLIYEAKEDYKKSFNHFRRYTHLTDSVYSVKKANSLVYYQTIYETEKKEKDLAIQQSKIESQTAQQTYLIIGIVGLTLILIGAFLFIRKIISQKNQIEKEEQKVAESLVEKELLLKEIHHRVKNNLQIVYGLIHKQSRSSDDEKFKSLMEDSQNRIKSMAMIHQKLYQNNSFKEVDMKSYITELIKDIDATFKNRNQKIHTKVKMAVTKFHMDIAIPLGLILNELLTNTYKHAFNNSDGNVFVSIEKKEGLHEIKVKDDGIGIPNDLEIENSSSLGMSLIAGLCQQMKATFNYKNSNGSEFTIILNTNY